MTSQPRNDDRSPDGGFTLVELIVAIGLIAILFSIFSAGVVVMVHDQDRTRSVADAATQARKVFDTMDKAVRGAAALNQPVLSGNDWYLEFLTSDVKNSGAPFCTQWRVDTATQTLQQRTWPNSTGTVTATPWLVLATNVVNKPAATPPPFTVVVANSVNVRQQLQVNLSITSPTGHGAGLVSTLVARNTTTATQTNVLAGGVPINPVCTQVGRP